MKDYLIRDYRIRYWKIRDLYLKAKVPIVRFVLYCCLKRIESRCNCDLGTSYHDSSAEFANHPNLPHGLNGIVISRLAKIGKNATIFHQVTIGIRSWGGLIKRNLKLPLLEIM